MRACKDGDGFRVQDLIDIRAQYSNERWRNSHKTYDPPPIDFVRS